MSAPDVALIGDALSRAGLADTSVHAFDTLESTNAWLQRGDGARLSSRAICATDHQPAGSGRRGRGWQSGPGNLTFSLLAPLDVPASSGGLVSLATGVAVARAVADACDLPIMLKWPNDLWLHDSKLGGLLHEARQDGEGRLRIVAGIGINVCDESHLDAMGATSLQVRGVDPERRDALLAAIAVEIFVMWKGFVEGGWASVAAAWNRFDALRDREVDVFESVMPATGGQARALATPDWSGIARGVDDTTGALRIETGAALRVVHAADVSVRAARGGVT